MKRLILTFALLGTLVEPTRASTVLALSIEELAQMSSVIVEGVVVGQESRRTDSHGIETLTTVRLARSYRTPLVDEITVWQAGGTVGAISQRISGAASFELGEEVLLFLEPSPTLKGAFVLVGLASAKFRIERSDSGVVATRDTTSLSFARLTDDGRIVGSDDGVPSRIELDSLRRRITDALP